MINRRSLCVSAFGLLITLFAHADAAQGDPRLAAKLEPILHSLDNVGAVYAARVIELPGGRELYVHNSDLPVMPASNGKLANDASALDHFGPNHTFKTYLAIDGDDLWLIGTGDPGCGDPEIALKHKSKPTAMLDQFSEAVKAHGVTHVKGHLYFYDGCFDDQWISPTWSRSYLTDWYAAPITGLTFNDNCIDTTLYATEPGKPARYEVVPPTENVLKIINEAKTAGAKQSDNVSIERDPSKNVFTLKGLVQKKSKVESKPITDPGAFFADAVRTNLKSHGIMIDGSTERAPRSVARKKWPTITVGSDPTGPENRLVAMHETPLPEVLARINKNSQNLFAEAVCKMQGREWNLAHDKDEPGSWESGGEAIHDFLRRNKIDDSKYVLVDGSGLSRDNRVTARLITDLFNLMSTHRYAKDFYDSLTVCGSDGTLKKRMKDIAGMVRGKTGSIGGVRSLSGYVTTRSGKTLAFSIIYNQAGRRENRCEVLADEACHVLVEWPNVDKFKTSSGATTR